MTTFKADDGLFELKLPKGWHVEAEPEDQHWKILEKKRVMARVQAIEFHLPDSLESAHKLLWGYLDNTNAHVLKQGTSTLPSKAHVAWAEIVQRGGAEGRIHHRIWIATRDEAAVRISSRASDEAEEIDRRIDSLKLRHRAHPGTSPPPPLAVAAMALEVARARLLPRLLTPAMVSAAGGDPLTSLIANTLQVALELEGSSPAEPATLVSKAQARAWGLQMPDLLEMARRNLQRRPLKAHTWEDDAVSEAHILGWDDGYTCERILIPDILKSVCDRYKAGLIVVAVPDRGGLIASHHPSPEFRNFVEKRFRKAKNAVSPEIFRWNPKQPTVLQRIGSGPL